MATYQIYDTTIGRSYQIIESVPDSSSPTISDTDLEDILDYMETIGAIGTTRTVHVIRDRQPL